MDKTWETWTQETEQDDNRSYEALIELCSKNYGI